MAEKMIQTNLLLTKKIWERAKARGAKERMSLSEVMRRALEQYLKKKPMTQQGGEIERGQIQTRGGGIPMLVKVIYRLSEKGRIEAVRKNLPAQKIQEKYFEDPQKKSMNLPDFAVDEKGTPTIDLQEWHIHMTYLKKRPATLEIPIESIDEVFRFYEEAEKEKKRLEKLLPQIKEEYVRVTSPKVRMSPSPTPASEKLRL